MTTDSDDLRDYLRKGDERAFRRIVERHSAMVHGVATRMTGNRALAEEITQAVFCTLARKAKSIGHPEIARWLYTVAVSECRNASRKEARRMHLMQAYGESMKTHTASDEEPWTDIRPHLDEALQRLSAKDRQFVILRFLENRSFREIAAFTGQTEENCRQISRRAIDRLAKLLHKRAALSPHVALASILAAHAASSPSASAAIISAAAMQSLPAGPVGAGLLKTILFMNAQKITKASIVALVIAAIPAAIYLRPEPLPRIEADQVAASASLNGGPESTRAAGTKASPAIRGAIDWDAVAANFEQTNPVTRLIALRKLQANFKKLSREDLIEGLEGISNSNLSEISKLKLREMLAEILAPMDPMVVLNRFPQDVGRDMAISLTPGLRELARQDFPSAKAWLEKQREEGRFDERSPNGQSRYLEYYQGAMLKPLAENDPAEFGKQFLALPPEERGSSARWALGENFQKAAETATKSGDPAVLTALLESDYTTSAIKMNNTNGKSNDAIYALLEKIPDPVTRERVAERLNAVANQSYKGDRY